MEVLAWVVWVALAGTLGVGFWKWFGRTREIIAPLPILVATVAFYLLPRGAYLLAFGRAPLATAALPRSDQVLAITIALVMGLVAVIGFMVGHASQSADKVGRSLPFALPEPQPDRARWIAAAAALVGGLALADLIGSLGSIEYALRHQYEIGTILQNKQPVFQLTRLLIVPVALLLVDPRTRRSRPWVWALAIATAVALFPLGRRAFILLALGYPFALYHLTVRRVPARWLATIAVVGAVGLVSLGYLRLLGGERLSQAARVFKREPATAVHFAFNASGELRILDALVIVVRNTPAEMDFTYGTTFIRVPWMVIPRSIWPEKPVTLGERIVTQYVPALQTGYPPTAVGEFYSAAGPLGVALGFVALGWLSRCVWGWYQARSGAGNATLYLAFCFFIYDFTRVGDPSRTVWFLLLGWAFFSLAFSWAARLPRNAGAPVYSRAPQA